MMFYMPGIDGTGLAAYRQFPRLTRAFDLRCLIIPRTDRSTFEELVDYVAVSELQLHQQAQHEWSLSTGTPLAPQQFACTLRCSLRQ